MTELYNKLLDTGGDLERGLGVPEGFLKRLLEEDDWSFIIKSHALLEAAAAHALTVATNLEAARDFYSEIPLSSNTMGKLALIRALNLLRPKERGFVRYLSEVRNEFVHDVRNVGIDFGTYFSKFSAEKKRQYAEGLCYIDFDLAEGDPEPDPLQSLAGNPKKLIWGTLLFTVAMLQLKIDTAYANKLMRDMRLKIAALL